MKIFTSLSTLPVFKNAALTVGTFDGVHCGHQQIIEQLKQEAQKINGETVIVTFYPHPRKIISSVPGDIKLLSTVKEKEFLLAKAGIDNLVIVAFNYRFANLSPEKYIEDFLVKNFHPHTVIIGYDHRFGKDRKGDFILMEKEAKKFGFIVKEIPEHLLAETKISSTGIRRFLLESKIAEANHLLGYNYFFEGLVIEGNKLGRRIGFPTANLHIEDEEKLIPANGVYAVKIQVRSQKLEVRSTKYKVRNTKYEIGNQKLSGMMNIGVRPTIDGHKRMIEINIFNFDEDIYGQTLQVQVHQYIRSEVKFNSLDELKIQLQKDKATAIKMLS